MIDHCSWDAPGADRYTGNAEAAIHAYADIPTPARMELIAKIRGGKNDDHVAITRDGIAGTSVYSDFRMMHFGSRGKVCNTVSRSKWANGAIERGLVYCVQNFCVVRPSVCNNWARITKQESGMKEGENAAITDVAIPPEVPLAGSFADAAAPAAASAGPAAEATQAQAGGASAGSFASASAGGGGGGGAVVITGMPGTADPGVVAAVPEPETYTLMLFGLLAVVVYGRKKRLA